MKQLITLKVNGCEHEIAVQPWETVLTVLRDHLGLVGPKRGCDAGGCGCCTVHADGAAVYSCMMFALSAQDKEITTIEGISKGGLLHPLQQAFIDKGAVQCGYCTSGILMSAKQYIDEMGEPDEMQIRQSLSGNLCRCTGYQKIVDAVQSVAENAIAPTKN